MILEGRRRRGAALRALVAMCTRLELLGARRVHPLPAACEPREVLSPPGQRLQADPAYICLSRGGHCDSSLFVDEEGTNTVNYPFSCWDFTRKNIEDFAQNFFTVLLLLLLFLLRLQYVLRCFCPRQPTAP